MSSSPAPRARAHRLHLRGRIGAWRRLRRWRGPDPGERHQENPEAASDRAQQSNGERWPPTIPPPMIQRHVFLPCRREPARGRLRSTREATDAQIQVALVARSQTEDARRRQRIHRRPRCGVPRRARDGDRRRCTPCRHHAAGGSGRCSAASRRGAMSGPEGSGALHSTRETGCRGQTRRGCRIHRQRPHRPGRRWSDRDRQHQPRQRNDGAALQALEQRKHAIA